MLTDAQVRLYRTKRMAGKTQEAAAAAAGVSVRSGRAWETGPYPSETKKARTWRTREDPLAGVWEHIVVPLLEQDTGRKLQAKTVLAELRRHEPKRFVTDQTLRTLQRRMRKWRAVHGPERDVVFPQEHPPGREGALDFTHADELGVTIGGVAFVHLLFTFRLSFSGWTWLEVAFSKTFEALLSGYQGAVWELGGVPAVARHDNLSAATRELKQSGGRALTTRWRAVMDHYGSQSTRITPGTPHENGGAEKGNDLVKTALEQALIVRGSRDFPSVVAWQTWARATVDEAINATCAARLAQERPHLEPLPSSRLPEYTMYKATVRKWSTVRVGGRAYSVPSRLINHKVEARLYADHVDVWFGGDHIERMPRLRGDQRVRIDYRHVIWSLVRKPGAFARYRFREELFPRLVFRHAYDRLKQWRGDRADIEYVRILHLAASTMEQRVAEALAQLVAAGERFDYAAVQALAAPPKPSIPQLEPRTPDLTQYDRLIGGVR